MTREAFGQRVMALEGLLYRVARSQCVCRADCEDAVQEALRRAWQHRDRLHDEDTFQAWLVRILLNVCHDQARRARRVVPMEHLPERGVTDAQEHPLLDALNTLPPELRSLLVLHHVEGWDIEALSKLLRVPRGTVKSRLARARQLLRRAYDGEGSA